MDWTTGLEHWTGLLNWHSFFGLVHYMVGFIEFRQLMAVW